MQYAIVGVNVLLGVFGQIFIKNGMNQVGEFQAQNAVAFFINAFTNLSVLFGMLLYGISLFLWVVLLSRLDLSVAYPMLSLGYLVILATSYFILDESVNWINIVGAVMICGGVLLVTKR